MTSERNSPKDVTQMPADVTPDHDGSIRGALHTVRPPSDWQRRLNIFWRALQIIVTFYLIITLQNPLAMHWVELPWAPIAEKALDRSNRS